MRASTTDIPPVGAALTEMGLPYRVFRHAEPVTSLEQAARERSQLPEQVVRSILFRVGQDTYIMALVAGPAQISWRSLRKHLGRSRLTMATPDEVLSVTGYAIGAVGPLGLRQAVSLLVDSSVLTQGVVSLGSGVHGVAVIVSTDDLMTALGDAEVIDLHERRRGPVEA